MAQGLAEYARKRDFGKTPEPAPTPEKGKAGRHFMVHMHGARRLHWDLRIEIDGVLKSWAVTRGPSADPADKRLAVRTEDHPLAYGGFEGVIPKGAYGAGPSLIWDEGDWEDIDGKSAAKTLEEGHLHLKLNGKRMHGEWLLVRMKPRPGERSENWLLRKVADETDEHGDLAAKYRTSVKSGLTLEQLEAGTPPLRKTGSAKPALPAFRAPQLATLVDRPPEGDAWLHEIKFDGYRCLLAIAGGTARAYSRSGLDWSAQFAPIVAAARSIEVGSALIDGEVVALDEAGKPAFGLLQQRLQDGGELRFQAFDLLDLNGQSIADKPLTDRKEQLRRLIGAGHGPILYTDHITGSGEAVLAEACRMGLEGIVSKRADTRAVSGRSTSWLKAKCTRREEYVIVGWLPSAAGRGFRSLLLGTHMDGDLRYAGKVGTGFGERRIADILERLEPLRQKGPTVKAPAAAVRGAVWVKPQLVAEVAYANVTDEGVLRHASFIGLRADKPAAEIVPEQPALVLVAPAGISNPDRVLFPETAVTKGMLAAYVEAMAPHLLRTIGGRPISLVRCPGGRGKACFFQRHAGGGFGGSFGPHVKALTDPQEPDDKWLYVDDAEGLLACVQMGTIEFHGWGATAADLERPDRMVFDLDPDEGMAFPRIVAAARELREQLGALGLESLPMLSGGKGIHVVVSLKPFADWPQVKDFARRFALAMEQQAPERYTASMSKARRKGRIFIDWLRNQRGATSVMPWSVRARPHAPVAVPVGWDELDTVGSASRWTLLDVADLARRAGDLAHLQPGRARLPDL